jgi:hypothetical protein
MIIKEKYTYFPDYPTHPATCTSKLMVWFGWQQGMYTMVAGPITLPLGTRGSNVMLTKLGAVSGSF